MIGPHADATQAMLSEYHGSNNMVNKESPLDAAKKSIYALGKVTYSLGVNTTGNNATLLIPEAAEAAKAADVAIVVVGMSPCAMDGCNEGESHDRTWSSRPFGTRDVQTDNLGLPGSQQKLLEAVYQANPKTVLVLINGGALGVDWAKDHIPAIVEAF
jgi:beta-glucosidase